MTYIGKIEQINKGLHFQNAVVTIKKKQIINVKLQENDDKQIILGQVYQLEVKEGLRENKPILISEKITPLKDLKLKAAELEKIVNEFYDYAPLSLTVMKKEIEKYLTSIKNEILLKITKKLYQQHENAFYLHPAATKFHHAHFGGLAYHTLMMLKMAQKYQEQFPFLSSDLLYSSIILHDISKIDELTGVEGEYTKEGLLIGHIVMATTLVDKAAHDLGFEATEEVLVLKHSIVSHHGLLQFGSPKKPQTAEALILWYIDTIDSKLTELGNALKEVKPGEFTQNINVLDKMRFYKHKL